MSKNKAYSYVLVNDAFLALPEVKEIKAKFKSVGFEVAVRLQMELSRRKYAIGKLSNLRSFVHELGIQKKTLLAILDECSMFTVDYNHGIFYMPRLRKRLHMEADVTDEEVNDVCANGNVYIGYGRKKAVSTENFEKETKNFSKCFENCNAESLENQSENCSSIKSKSKIIKSIDDKIPDDADEIVYRNILSAEQWRSSIRNRLGVNLEDTETLGIFARWMYNYCCSNDKHPKSRTDMLQYANHLLSEDSLTRADFYRFYDKEIAGRMTQTTDSDDDMQPIAEYENVRNGVRYSCDGQIIPDMAPKQPAPQMAFSYVRNGWIPIDEYDRKTETEAFDRNMKNDRKYVSNYGGEIW